MNTTDFFTGKRVCVTGATGLIGSYVVKALIESGAHVRAIVHDRGRNEFTRMAHQVYGYDLLYPNEARVAVRGMDAVMACAGMTGGAGLSAVDPVGFVGPATMLAMNTLHAAHLEGVQHFGHISSTTVYAASDEPVREDDIGPAPYAGYAGVGEAKRFLEKLCRYYHDKTGMGVAVVRPSGVYGRFDNFDEKTGHVIPGMITRALRGGETFEVWGDGEDVRDFVHASDVAAGLLAAVANVSDGDPVNIASGVATTTRDLASTVVAAVKSVATTRLALRPDKPTAMRVRRVDISKAKRVLGWEPRMSLSEGIQDAVEWARRQK